ncbi:Mur ligase family protein, partial [Patescibacteria group bacterium]
IIERAKRKIKKSTNLKVIAIVGSYGKTTMKEIIGSVLVQDKKTLITPSSINTPIGISRLILNKLSYKTEVFIVEMGEYYPGDITKLCKIVKPDFGIITGINEAHLERMGSLVNTIKTIFEIAPFVDGDKLYLNADDNNLARHYKKFILGNKASWFTSNASKLSKLNVKNRKFDQEKIKQSFDIYEKYKKIASFQTRLIGDYVAGNIVTACLLADYFKIPILKVINAVIEVNPIPHRLEVISNFQADIVVIDDSYNGNPAGVESAIKLLSKFTKKRKVYITPGLVETGKKTKDLHVEIGKNLSRVADLVILVKNSVTPFIADGLVKSGFGKENIIWFNSALSLQTGFSRYIRPGDVVMFQNDWPDNYV